MAAQQMRIIPSSWNLAAISRFATVKMHTSIIVKSRYDKPVAIFIDLHCEG